MSRVVAERKRELAEQEARNSALRSFEKTYVALVTTLAETYPQDKALSETKARVKEWGGRHWKTLASVWAKAATPASSRDASVFKRKPSLFQPLRLHAHWPSFSETSKDYTWRYLEQLARFSVAATAQRSIRAPPNLDGHSSSTTPSPATALPALAGLYKQIPRRMLSQVEHIAEKYGKDIKQDGTGLDKVDFGQISKELFSKIHPQDMQAVMKNMTSLMKNFA
jgi:hypothetical protein